ncbi:hypothetical protein ACOME3_006862 [Neoechinorhynchus agilis]
MAGSFKKSSHYGIWLVSGSDIVKMRYKDCTNLKISEAEYLSLLNVYVEFIQAVGEALKFHQQLVEQILNSNVQTGNAYSTNSCSVDQTSIVPSSPKPSLPVQGKVLSNALNRLNVDKIDVRSYDDMLTSAWSFLNDCYKTDVPLLYSPKEIALASVVVGNLHSRTKCLSDWIINVDLDLQRINDIIFAVLKVNYCNARKKKPQSLTKLIERVPRTRINELLATSITKT